MNLLKISKMFVKFMLDNFANDKEKIRQVKSLEVICLPFAEVVAQTQKQEVIDYCTSQITKIHQNEVHQAMGFYESELRAYQDVLNFLNEN